VTASFAVFKKVETDVVGFEDFFQSNKDKIDPELLAAKIYGPTYDRTKPYDGIERGMLFHFINSNIENQYEFVLRQWVMTANSPGL
jgi:hypothetical protein